ncbi:undecaprenyl-diphosphatase [Heyndrickxia sp. NPDC080065]|uniref:undecaprenyl-diphosphatase n=1 Tax=Heyndrickxia sp. NPDC080065 TaxID=3390568 RepID=UPI003D020892
MSFSEINIDVFRAINDLGAPNSAFNPVVIFFAEYMLYFLFLVLVFHWFTRRTKNRMMVIQAVIATVVAEVLGKIAGHFYSHNQPFAVLPHVNKLIDHAIDNSFPSDHSIVFFSICVSVWLVRKKEWWLWLILAPCVAISRVWVGVHYPVDVLTGALLGIISALFVYWLVPKLAFIKQLLNMYEKVENRILPSKNKTENF